MHCYGVGTEVDLSYASHSPAFFLSGAAQQGEDLYVMINAYGEELLFMVEEDQVSDWRRVIDTSLPNHKDFRDFGHEQELPSLTHKVHLVQSLCS